MKVLIDTNVILDALASREPFRAEAETIFALAAAKSVDAEISASSLTDIFYILRKATHDAALTRNAIGKLITLFGIQDVTQADCINAIASPMPDFEDAMLAACADRRGVDYIVSRNTKDFESSPVPVVTPQQFITMTRSSD